MIRAALLVQAMWRAYRARKAWPCAGWDVGRGTGGWCDLTVRLGMQALKKKQSGKKSGKKKKGK